VAPRPLILIVDDDPDTRHVYGFALEAAGFRWSEAVSGQDAMTQAQLERPALILMDLAMPRRDGWDAIAQLQADPVTRAIPFVILTGDGSEESRVRATGAGAAGFLVKPVLPDVLVAEAERLLNSRASSS
jgi:CheY-like chemotaxis protein